MITSLPKQRQTIGFLRKLLGFDDDMYREILSFYGAKSSKNLTISEADELIANMKDYASKMGLYTYNKYEKLGYRKGMATPKQLRYIYALWKNVSFINDDKAREQALNRFIYRITGKERVNFLTPSDVSKIIEALKAMQTKKEKTYANS